MSRLKGKLSAGKMRGAVVIREGSGSGSSTWGNILGDINNQTDLKNALNGKLPNSHNTDPNAHANAFEAKLNKTAVKQAPGQSTTDVMSQKAVTDELGKKANIDGYYESLSVGRADNLVDRKAPGVQRNFTFDTSCGDASISDDGTGVIQSIHGNTLVWNQLIPNSQKSYTSKKADTRDYLYLAYKIEETKINIGSHSSGVSNFNAIFTSNATVDGYAYLYSSGVSVDIELSGFFKLSVISGHKYYSRIKYVSSNPLVVGGISYSSNMLIDLTQMFGAGKEPSTVDEFKKLFPLDYYAYNPGELISFNGTGIKTVGFNQWDKNNVENGYVNNVGEITQDSQHYTSDYIICLNSFNYFVKNVESGNYQYSIGFYDSEKNFISRRTVTENMSGHSASGIITTPSNCRFMRVTCHKDYADSCCVNFSWSGYRNGEYEPYWSRTLALPIADYFPDGMKSAGTVYDELTKDKAVKKIGVKVYNGTENWTYNYGVFYISFSGASSGNYIRYISNLYDQDISNSSVAVNRDKSFQIIQSATYISIKDDSITSLQMFKNKLATTNFVVYYELATPVETPIDPPLNLTYQVSDFGTEQLLPENDDEPVTTPFNGIIAYSTDFTRQLATMKKNYQSQDSMDALLSALGSACGGTFTKTWDSTNSKWTYAFTPAQEG